MTTKKRGRKSCMQKIPDEVMRVLISQWHDDVSLTKIYGYLVSVVDKPMSYMTFTKCFETYVQRFLASEGVNRIDMTMEDLDEKNAELPDLVSWMEENIKVYDRFAGEVVGYSYDGREYLFDLHYSMIEKGRDTVWLKSRQVEASTSTIDVMMFLLTNRTLSVGHTFPTKDKAARFSKEKMGEFLLYNPTFGERAYNKSQSVLERGFYNNFGNLSWYRFVNVGSNRSEDARSLTFDALILDEFDDMPMGSMGVLMGSMLHSPFKKIITLFTPKLPESPSIKKWEQSTMNKFYFRCRSCGHLNHLTLDSIKYDEEKGEHIYACSSCGTEIDKTLGRVWDDVNERWKVNPEYGEWIPDNPDGIHDGYFVNQMMLPNLTAEDIYRMSIDPLISKRTFFNEIMGYTFAGEEAPITEGRLWELVDNTKEWGTPPPTSVALIMGIDWGKVSNYIIMAKLKNGASVVYDAGEITGTPTKQLEWVKDVLMRYPSMVAVVDSGYDLGRIMKLQELFGSRVWGCSYKGDGYPEWKKGIDAGTKKKTYMVQVNHSFAVEGTISLIEKGEILFAGASVDRRRLKEMFKNMSRVSKSEVIITKSGTEVRRIRYDVTPAHYFMALLYASVEAFMKPVERSRLSYVSSERILMNEESNERRRNPFRIIKNSSVRRNRRNNLLRR